MAIKAVVVADSISATGKRLTTLALTYPRFIHGEFMTHRVFSRNAQSSRAIPVKLMRKQVWNDPVMPLVWQYNKSGMQSDEFMFGKNKFFARLGWKLSAKSACISSWIMEKAGLHKQWANRVLEPFQEFNVLVTSTEWANFINLRHHKDAQPEIYDLASKIDTALRNSQPRKLKNNQWHLPYITVKEMQELDQDTRRKVSVARCARVSYFHPSTNKISTVEQDLKLYDRLVATDPIHASPAEHQAYPDIYRSEKKKVWANPSLHGNINGWIQNRKLIERGKY